MIINKLKNFAVLFNNAAEKGILLIFSALAAMIIANTSIGPFYDIFFNGHIKILLGELSFDFTLHNFINDFLMAFFFLLVGIEIKRELINGHLSSAKDRILPVTAAIAGVAFPAIIYSVYNYDDPIAMRGWAVPIATDIAFALAVYAVFAKHLPTSLRIFLTALAIIDDLIAVMVIAIFYSSGISFIHILGIILVSFLIRALGLRKNTKISLYFLLGGILWVLFAESGIHATVAGVLLGLLMPTEDKNSNNPSVKMENLIHPVVLYVVLPLFAFANSGVMIDKFSPQIITNDVTLSIILGLFFGKQLGIFSITWATIKLGFATLPKGTNFKQFYGVSIICGIGFTMSLFIGELAFVGHSEYINHIKIGVLVGSFVSAIVGALSLRFFR